MRVHGSWICLSGLVVVALLAPAAQAEKKTVELKKTWTGAVLDETQQQLAPECITNAKVLEKVWKAWKIEEKMPKVDFAKEIVIVTSTNGSKINLSARLDDAGDLEVLGAATLDLAPGFRYVIATVSREGVKTVNKKKLPKE